VTRLRTNGGIIGNNVTVSSSGSSGVFDLASQAYWQEQGSWPEPPFFPTATTTLVEDATPQLINLYGEISTTSNTSAAYRVLEISYTPTSSGSKTFYIGYRVPSFGQSTFYHDYTVAGVQLADSSVLETYQNTTWTSFQTTTDKNTSSLTTVPTGNTYTNVATGTTANRFNIDSAGTSSSRTGMANGINRSGSFGNGGSSISQTSGRSYLYIETSGASVNNRIWLRKTFSTSFSTSTTYTIRVAHFLNTTTGYTQAQAFGNTAAIYIT